MGSGMPRASETPAERFDRVVKTVGEPEKSQGEASPSQGNTEQWLDKPATAIP